MLEIILKERNREEVNKAEALSPLAMSKLRKEISSFNYLQNLCCRTSSKYCKLITPTFFISSQLSNFATFKAREKTFS